MGDMEELIRPKTVTEPSGGGATGDPHRRHRTAAPEAAVALLLRLQKILEPEALLDALVVELKSIAPAVRVSFRHGAERLRCGHGAVWGEEAVHRLRLDGEKIGDVTVHGSRSFTPEERDLMRFVLGWFQYPLRNALRQRVLQRQAHYDPLTGLLNRSTLSDVLDREVALAERHGEIFSVIMLDIDRFKAINDRYGHAAGDSVLCQISNTLRRCSRRTDLLFRFAGDEFLLGSSHTNRVGAAITAERILDGVAATRFRHGGENLPPIRVSIGIAALRTGESVGSLFERADRALYCAKRGGRNRIEVG